MVCRSAIKLNTYISGGRIDHSHHFNNAHRALTDTLALEDAVSAALDMTKSDDTLIVVTSDHSHVFAFGGNPKRGNPILGKYSKLSTFFIIVIPLLNGKNICYLLKSLQAKKVPKCIDFGIAPTAGFMQLNS